MTLNICAPEKSQALTARELEISFLAGSRSNAEIAARLGLSTRTVEAHISKAMKKTRAVSRSGLCAFVQSSAK